MISSLKTKTKDKTEVAFENVSFANPVSLDIYNSDLSIIPTFKLMDCKFQGNVDIERSQPWLHQQDQG